MLNLGHFLDVTAEAYPDTVAVIADEFRMTYRQLSVATKRAASMLHARGIGRGDKVAMMIPNTPEFPIIYYGILQAGATVVPVNVLYKRQEILHYLRDAEAVAFFAYAALEQEAIPAFDQAEQCTHLIRVGGADDQQRPVRGEDFAALLAAAAPHFDTVQTMPDDTAVILYTSGTTGAPKGAELTHFQLFFNNYWKGREINGFQPGDVCLVALPLSHTFGQNSLMNASVLFGVTMSLLSRFETQKAMQVIQRDKVTFIAMVPTMYFFFLNELNWRNYDFSSLRRALSGGAALPADVHRLFKERYGVSILEGYGLSETSPAATYTRPGEERKVGSVGKAFWGIDVRIMREDGSFAEAGEVGEVVIRGHNVMKGYYKRPEATREAIVDGWFHTGDLGKLDDEGSLYIVDRKKDLIIRGGMNIYPREIEEVLYRHPKIHQAAVIGIPDEARGEEVKLCVSAKEGETLDAEEILAYCKEHMARYKWPREIEILPQLPLGPTGKILKRALKPSRL